MNLIGLYHCVDVLSQDTCCGYHGRVLSSWFGLRGTAEFFTPFPLLWIRFYRLFLLLSGIELLQFQATITKTLDVIFLFRGSSLFGLFSCN